MTVGRGFYRVYQGLTSAFDLCSPYANGKPMRLRLKAVEEWLGRYIVGNSVRDPWLRQTMTSLILDGVLVPTGKLGATFGEELYELDVDKLELLLAAEYLSDDDR